MRNRTAEMVEALYSMNRVRSGLKCSFQQLSVTNVSLIAKRLKMEKHNGPFVLVNIPFFFKTLCGFARCIQLKLDEGCA